MPADNKNLITFVTITTLFAISTAAAFALGFQLSSQASKNNLTTLQEYRHLEAEIINAYEDQHGLETKINKHNHQPLYKYYNQDGIVTPIYAAPHQTIENSISPL
jgi:hypothetical protein